MTSTPRASIRSSPQRDRGRRSLAWLPVVRHCSEIASADGIIIVHPNWWGQPPAILKGWVDRVSRPGVAYRFLEGDGGEGVPVGLLKAETAIIFNTSNTPEEREATVFGDPLDNLWKACHLRVLRRQGGPSAHVPGRGYQQRGAASRLAAAGAGVRGRLFPPCSEEHTGIDSLYIGAYTLNTRDAITARRSIRTFKSDPIPADVLQAILTAAIQSPSAKNRQPWRFVVVSGDQRAEMVRLMRQGIAGCKAQGMGTGSAEGSATIMEQAPVTVFVFNPAGLPPWQHHSVGQMFDNLTNIQSIGAAIQNMLLAAFDLGVGSLWICDVLFAYEELRAWLGETGTMIAAVSFGYPAESPAARPRKPVSEVTRWMGGQSPS